MRLHLIQLHLIHQFIDLEFQIYHQPAFCLDAYTLLEQNVYLVTYF